jgi:hypothetical protein
MDTIFAIGLIDWKLEFNQGVTDFLVDANFAIRPIQLAIRN